MDNSEINFRIPSHPEVLAALGRLVYNFLYIEEMVVAILYEADHSNLVVFRRLKPNVKLHALRKLLKELISVNAPQQTIDSLNHASEAFELVKDKFRNTVLHGSLFTSSPDNQGNFMPGIQIFNHKTEQSTFLYKPQEILEMASEMEQIAIDPLARCRMEMSSYFQKNK